MLNPAAEFDYSPRVRELFADLAHAGSLSDAADALSAQAGSREHGVSVHLWLVVRDARIQAIRYKAYGCPHFLAACEDLARRVEGHVPAELANWRWRQIETELQVPAEKRSRLLLLEEVLRQLSEVTSRLA